MSEVVNVGLTLSEIRLIRAGLAAHSNLMDGYQTKPGTDAMERAKALEQKRKCRDLSVLLGEILIEAGGVTWSR